MYQFLARHRAGTPEVSKESCGDCWRGFTSHMHFPMSTITIGRLAAQVSFWSEACQPSGAGLHSSNELGGLSQWLFILYFIYVIKTKGQNRPLKYQWK